MKPVVTLDPRTYHAVDLVTKLVGLVALTVALTGSAGSFSLLVGLLGVLFGIATVFVDVSA